jgi:hypothetical protein
VLILRAPVYIFEADLFDPFTLIWTAIRILCLFYIFGAALYGLFILYIWSCTIWSVYFIYLELHYMAVLCFGRISDMGWMNLFDI